MKYYIAKRYGAEIARDQNLMKLRWKVRNYIETYGLDWNGIEIYRVKNNKVYLVGHR